ncbi:probable serine/threonine-protein kinase At1g09600 isoform X2 [Andrographis paniculata]|nr:probable serine/threonine-protein kinase At1g09600 isoform X2 [Andrographis paniculata]
MARDLTNNKTVAMKKVRFVNMDPESVRFMAREVCILRRLDHHPNVMKLDALVLSRVSGSFYLVFDYMEHDLAGLLASPDVPKFTEPQIKCFMKQILCGLEHCHSCGILHRDIKGANLLVDSKGNLKIGDFGLANFQKQPLTSRVVTLWYRAPELLLGAKEYGPAIDLWSVGCILAELFIGKPIMPGRTEVEQMHKIFKLCGSPTEEYWTKAKFPHASSFKSQRAYKRRLSDVFREFPPSALALLEVLLSIDPEGRGTAASALKSQFFVTNPLPCDPSSLPKYPPSKEFDARLREEARRKRQREMEMGMGMDESAKGCEAEYAKNNSTVQKPLPQEQLNRGSTYVFNQQEEERQRRPIGDLKAGLNHSSSMIHPTIVGGYSWGGNKINGDPGLVSARTLSSSQHGNGFQVLPSLQDPSDYHSKDTSALSSSNNLMGGYAPKRSRIHFSGPLMPPGGNMEDMLKEHERQIQEAVRKTRMGKPRPE